METLKERTVGQIVARDYRAAQVFRDFKLDFCCGGNKTIDEACADKGLDPKEIREALQALDTNGEKEENYNSWSLDFLIDYIINNHHEYSRRRLPEIGFYAKKVAKVHGPGRQELVQIYEEFTKLHAEMINHLDKEEEILFPYIMKLVEAERNDSKPDAPNFHTAANPVAMMEQEHDEAGEAMAKIRRLSDDYTLPVDACATYTVLFESLEAFEKDLHKHVHLENNILFPKALEMEKRLS